MAAAPARPVARRDRSRPRRPAAERLEDLPASRIPTTSRRWSPGCRSSPSSRACTRGNYQQCWGQPWTDTSTPIPKLGPWECAAAPWFMNASRARQGVGRVRAEVVEAHRHQAARARPTETSIVPTQVSDIHEDVDSISFHVSEIGKPVLVRTSYFPNWKAQRRDRPVPRRAEPHGGRADEPRREAHLRPDHGRLARPHRHAVRDRRASSGSSRGRASSGTARRPVRSDGPDGTARPDGEGGTARRAVAVAPTAGRPTAAETRCRARKRRRRAEPVPVGPSPSGGNRLRTAPAAATMSARSWPHPPVGPVLRRSHSCRSTPSSRPTTYAGSIPRSSTRRSRAASATPSPTSPGAQQVIVGHDMRPSSEPLTAAFIEGATLAGADVTDIGLCSTDVVYFAAGKLDAPGAMFTASHNPAQYNGIKLCRSGAAPVGEQTGLDADQGDGRGGRHVARRGRGQGRAPRPARGVRRSRAIVRRHVGAAPAHRRRRHRQRHGRPRGAEGVRGTARSRSRSSSASSTARSRTIRPTRSSSRTSRTSSARCSISAPTSGSRSTATPTVCSSSTTPGSR